MIKTIRSINAIAQIIETTQARADLDQLLGIGSFSLDSVSHMLEQLDEEDHHAHGHSKHKHDNQHEHEHSNYSRAHSQHGHLSDAPTGVHCLRACVSLPLTPSLSLPLMFPLMLALFSSLVLLSSLSPFVSLSLPCSLSPFYLPRISQDVITALAKPHAYAIVGCSQGAMHGAALSPIYLPYISHISPVYLPCISLVSPSYLPCISQVSTTFSVATAPFVASGAVPTPHAAQPKCAAPTLTRNRTRTLALALAALIRS